MVGFTSIRRPKVFSCRSRPIIEGNHCRRHCWKKNVCQPTRTNSFRPATKAHSECSNRGLPRKTSGRVISICNTAADAVALIVVALPWPTRASCWPYVRDGPIAESRCCQTQRAHVRVTSGAGSASVRAAHPFPSCIAYFRAHSVGRRGTRIMHLPLCSNRHVSERTDVGAGTGAAPVVAQTTNSAEPTGCVGGGIGGAIQYMFRVPLL
jgi:hypothetical protein